MNIRINGKVEALDRPSTVEALVSDKGLSADRIVIEHNRRIVSKEEWPGIILRENDSIEIVSFVGGG
jgi:sulfur carrier protein